MHELEKTSPQFSLLARIGVSACFVLACALLLNSHSGTSRADEISQRPIGLPLAMAHDR